MIYAMFAKLIEQNGQLNVILKGDETIKYPLILDGEIDPAALDAIDHDEKWLKDRLAEQGYEPGDVYMASFLVDALLRHHTIAPNRESHQRKASTAWATLGFSCNALCWASRPKYSLSR